MTALELLSVTDLDSRWIFTRRAIERLTKADRAFPLPVATVSRRKVRLWQLSDIEAYERTRPWLTNLAEKERRNRELMRRIGRDGGRATRRT